jgi:VCBS repeat-containing protein
VDEDESVLIDVLADDTGLPETGETLTITAVGEPEHGTAVIESGQVRYTPDDNCSGGDSFTYTISDGNGGTATANITVTVSPVNDAPVVPEVDLVRLKEGQTKTITLPAEDTETDAGALVFKILSLPGLGVLKYNGVAVTLNQEITGSPLNLTYALARSEEVVGDTAFTYHVTDAGDGGSEAITSEVMTVGLDLIDVGETTFSFDAASGVVLVNGSDASDQVVFTNVGGNLRITVDGVVLSSGTPVSAVRSIRVRGDGGNDRVDGSAPGLPLYVLGGFGNDTILGGARRDVLDGQEGDDSLSGGNNDDLLAGGVGSDELAGGAGRDVLIGGALPASTGYATLKELVEDWSATGRPVSPFSTGDGITDEEEDDLSGGTGADWFIRNMGDVLDRSDVQGDKATTLT